MVTIFIAQIYRPSKVAPGRYVRGADRQFGTVGEALGMARDARRLGCRAEVLKVQGDPTLDLWDEPRVLKRFDAGFSEVAA